MSETGIIKNLFKRSVSLTDADEWERLFGIGSRIAGVSVTHESAMKMTAVFACVRVLAETIASLPLIVYRRNRDGSKERAPEFYLYDLLHNSPNPIMTSFQWRETMMGHLATWGNAYSKIEYDERGRILGFMPLRPDWMDVVIANNEKGYVYQRPSGQMILTEADVFHVAGLGFDGLTGYSPIAMARKAIGLGLAAEEFGAAFFGNGANPGGVLEHPNSLSQKAFDNLQKSVADRHGGPANASKLMILEEGMKYNQIGIPPDDAQFLETRRFQVEEVARIFRVPQHMIGELSRATWGNIEHQAIEFVVHTVRPWLVRWEQAITQQLFTESERKRYFVEFLVDGLLRGDTASRYQSYAVGRQWGWLSANDIRGLENMNPVEGGSEYLVPLNMTAAGQEPPAVQPARALALPEVRVTPVDIERRARESAASRQRIARWQREALTDTSRRILRRERNDVSGQARRILVSGQVAQVSAISALSEFERWLNEFYTAHTTWSAAQMLPTMRAYAGVVADAIANELGRDADLAQSVEGFINEYAAEFGRRESARSLAMLLDVLRSGLVGEGIVTGLEEKLDRWVEERADAIGHEESIRENNAVAVALYSSLGVERLISVATGKSTCPYCRALDGKTIGINEYFLLGGTDFRPEGAEAPLKVSHSKRHSPYHGGCDCIQVAG